MSEFAAAIVGALAASTPKAIGETAAAAVKDGYAALKKIIEDRYGSEPHVKTHLKALESDPSNKLTQDTLRASLAANPEKLDESVRQILAVLVSEISKSSPDAARAVGVQIDELRAATLRITNITVPKNGAGMRIKKAEISGAAEFDLGKTRPPKK